MKSGCEVKATGTKSLRCFFAAATRLEYSSMVVPPFIVNFNLRR